MVPSQLLRKPFALLITLLPRPALLSRPRHTTPRRFQSSRTRARAAKVLDRVPRSLRPYTERLRAAPVSHIVAFLVLHEVTAVVPLVGLAGAFHYGGWLPPLFSDSSYLAPGVEKFGNYFRRKGWFGLGGEVAGRDFLAADGEVVARGDGQAQVEAQARAEGWNLDSPGMRVVVEVAAAYAVTKALLPLRLMLSVWATPWFARVIIGRVWGGVLGLGRAGRGTGSVAAVGGVDKTAAMRKAAKEIGKDIPKT